MNFEKDYLPRDANEPTPEKDDQYNTHLEDKERELNKSHGESDLNLIHEALKNVEQAYESADDLASVTRTMDDELRGDFIQEEMVHGQIMLDPDDEHDLQTQSSFIKTKDNFLLPSLAFGKKTATTYDSRVANFSTKTSIMETASGKRVFAVDCYPLSQIHRWLDTFAKKILVGHRFSKASTDKWKETFLQRSNIPTIKNNDDRLVLMPYIPNINLYDLLANNKEIKDFGECPWAENLSYEDKKIIVDKIIEAVVELHRQKKYWGETITPNMIISADQRVIICDPETTYDEDVSPLECMASDLRDVVFSISSSLMKSGDASLEDVPEIVGQILKKYHNPAVIAELKNWADKKPGWLYRLFGQTYEFARLGIKNKDQYEKIREAILNFST